MRTVSFERDASLVMPRFPQRPDLRIVSEAIPLFYLCQNRHGFWIARDAGGQAGGLFLRKRSALRFAQRQSASGCAIMQLNEPIELDVENKGSRIAGPLGALVNVTMRYAPRLTAFFAMRIAKWHKRITQISATLASGREHRAAVERELFHGEYWLSTKGDDDLPIV